MPDTIDSPVPSSTTLTPEQELQFKKMLECAFINIGIEVGKQIREVFQAQIKMNQDNIKNLQAVLGILDGSTNTEVNVINPTVDCK